MVIKLEITTFEKRFSLFIARKIRGKKVLFALSILSDLLLWFESLIVLLKYGVKEIIWLILLWNLFVFIQKAFNRERPYVLLNLSLPYDTPINNSFPSSHTALSFAIYSILGGDIFWISLLIAALRVLSLQHWLLDVLFGGMIGYFVGLIVKIIVF